MAQTFDLQYPDGDPAYSTTNGGDNCTITFDGEPRWRVPLLTKLRWHVDLIWQEGWAAWWEATPWWHDLKVSVA